METIKDLTRFQTIQDTPVQEIDENSLETIPENSQNYYQGLCSNAFDVEVDPPKNADEIEADYELGASIVNERIQEDRINLLEGMIGEGTLSGSIGPKLSMDIIRSPYPDKDVSLQTLQAENYKLKAGSEDIDRANQILDNPDEADKQTKYTTNLSIFQTVLNDVDAAADEAGGGVSYFLRGFLPFVDTYRAMSTDLPGLDAGAFDYASKLNIEINSRMQSMEPQEFNKWLKGFVAYQQQQQGQSFHRISELLNKAVMPTNEIALSAIGDIADIATLGAAGIAAKSAGGIIPAAKELTKGAIETVPLLPSAVKLTKGTLKAAGKIPQLATDVVSGKIFTGNITGATATALQNIEKAVKAGEAGVETAEEAVKQVTKYMVDPFATASVPSGIKLGKAAEGIQTTEDLYREEAKLGHLLGQGSTLRKYYTDMFEDAWKAHNVETPTNLTQVTDMQPIVESTKVSGRVLFGPSEGHSFVSEAQANQALRRFMKNADKSSVSAEVVQAAPGSFFIQADVKLGNTIGEIFTNYSESTGKWSPKFLLGTQKSMPTGAQAWRQLATRDSNYIREKLLTYQKAVKALNKSDQKVLESLKELSKEKWFTPEYLRASGIPDNVVNAYMAARIVEDANYAVKAVYNSKRLAEEGWTRIATGLDPDSPVMTGRVISADDINFDKRYFSLGDGSKPQKIKASDFKKNYADKYAVVEGLYPIDEVPSKYAYLLVPKDNLRVFKLDSYFGSYIPGFRHFYDPDTYFIKQPIFQTLPSGRRVLSDIHTIRGATTLAEAQTYAKELENVRRAVGEVLGTSPKSKKFLSLKTIANQTLQGMDNKYLNFSNVDEAIAWAKENGVDLLSKEGVIGVLKEGETPSVFSKSLKYLSEDEAQDFTEFVNKYEFSSPSAIARMERGEGVKDISTDAHLPWMDVNRELNSVVREVERYGVMNDYTRVFASDWADTFKDVVDTSVDPVSALSRGLINKKGNAARVNQAAYAKLMHDYIRGVPNAVDKAAEQWLGNILMSIGENHEWLKNVPLLGNAFQEGSRTFKTLTTLKPIDWVKTYTSHFYLGLLRAKQLLTQGLAVTQTLAISPVAGAKALPYSFITPALLSKADDEAFEFAVKMLQNSGEVIEKSKVKRLVENLRHFDIYGQSIKGGAFADMDTRLGKLNELSFWFFRKGEAFNRVHSATTALMEKGLEFSDISKLSSKEMSELLVRAEQLYMNMGKTGVSAAQMSGVGKVLLQMKGFSLRGVEALVSSQLTAAERARLLLFNTMATGLAGTVGAKFAYNVYDWMTDDLGVSDETALMLQEGLLNTLTRQVMDHPIDIASLMNPEFGGFFEDLYDVATSGAMQFMAGSTVAGKTWNTMSTIGNAMSAWVNEEATTDVIKNTFRLLQAQGDLPPAFKEYSTALHMLTAGRKVTSSGALISEDMSAMDAVFAAMGIKTLSESDYYEFVARLGDERQKVTNAISDLKKIFTEVVTDPGKSFNIAVFDKYFAIVCDNYKLTPQQRQEVWKELNKRASENFIGYKPKILKGVVEMYGRNKAEEYLKARKEWLD